MPGTDPLMPMSSRFPLSPAQGRVEPNVAPPSGPGTRPFGMGFAVVPPVVETRHAKKPTNKTRQERTAITDDGKVVGYTPDTVTYVEMDEE